ncbi:neuroligin-2 [Nephila pilipes]|uniref:Neuroligin-2 n=1 Tax=Nephila pilipes TaxID=299642 RepID=A0A8X6N5X5_NEPPI|nr:neuroligin-2 [Nephila pilipes]
MLHIDEITGRDPMKLPVLVFIHGESYDWNAGNPYDGSILSSLGNVVVVTINYRLGILGFLPATEGSARGNYGLMDQVAALHWVQENIAEFGGDQKNVTIVGQGYGAAFVNLLMISPMARGGFMTKVA